MQNTLLFDPPSVKVDVQFWKWLMGIKLDKQMLKTDPIGIKAELSTGGMITVGSQSEGTGEYSGAVYNLNTIEDFTSKGTVARRQEMLESMVQQMKDDGAIEDMFKVLIISFADLKSYKFSYNLAFPVLSPTVPLTIQNTSSHPSFIFFGSHSPVKAVFLATVVDNPDSSITIDAACLPSSSSAIICRTEDDNPPWCVRNIIYFLSSRFSPDSIRLVLLRKNSAVNLTISPGSDWVLQPGWQKAGNSYTATADLRSLLDPAAMAADAVSLNVKLMKWRIVPELRPDLFSEKKFLLLGAGTLGCSVARALIAWGVKHISFADCGRVAFSNPVRQSLFTHADAVAGNFKAPTAAERLMEIVPSVESIGHVFEIPMPGHPQSMDGEGYDRLEELIDEHDVVFLLTDSRESRWLPSVICAERGKLAVSVALGFDSFLVKLQQPAVSSCYFCNDVSAPANSTSFRSLDMQCTVTRPGGSFIASAVAVEAVAAMFTHSSVNPGFSLMETHTVLGALPDQVRGYLGSFRLEPAITSPFSRCVCCSDAILAEYRSRGRDFVTAVAGDSKELERLCSLDQLKSAVDAQEVINFDSDDE